MKSHSTDKAVKTSENGKEDVSADKETSGVRLRLQKDLEERRSEGVAKSRVTAGMENYQRQWRKRSKCLELKLAVC